MIVGCTPTWSRNHITKGGVKLPFRVVCGVAALRVWHIWRVVKGRRRRR
jgi:hypothetical protein